MFNVAENIYFKTNFPHLALVEFIYFIFRIILLFFLSGLIAREGLDVKYANPDSFWAWKIAGLTRVVSCPMRPPIQN